MIKLLAGLFITLLAMSNAVRAETAEGFDPKDIIEKFAQKETEFRDVWEKYTYTQRVEFEVLNAAGQPKERRVMDIEVYFTNDGKRHTRVLSDRGELRSVGVSEEDIQDAIGLQPFVLTTEDLPNYEVKYKGRERVDELDTHIFEVKPKKMKGKERYFKGKIWVDAIDHQIVMTQGKAVPDYANNKFPKFETRREQIEGDYWFPTWTRAEDHLTFGGIYDRYSVHIRQFITYENFRRFDVGTSIKYGKVEDE